MADHAFAAEAQALGRHDLPAKSVNKHFERRSFLKLTASMICLGRTSPGADACAQVTTAPTSAVPQLPGLDGILLVDDVARRAAAQDWGQHVHRSPAVVVRAGSTNDVVRAIAYAYERGLKIAMRGQGHSVYGQAQVDGGVVIDSTGLNAVNWRGAETLDAQPGALWSAVAMTALSRALIPPVMPDALMLSSAAH